MMMPEPGGERHQARPGAQARGRAAVGAAQIVHGKLAVTVADSGVGFGKSGDRPAPASAEQHPRALQLLYGNKASLAVAETRPAAPR